MPIMRLEGRQGYIALEPNKNYYWKVEGANLKYSAKGDEQIQLVMKVGDKNGQAKIYETLTFSEKAYFRIEEFLKSAGMYHGDDIEVYFDDSDVVGLSGYCTVRYERNEKNNRDYPRIEKWLEANKQNPDPKWVERARLNSSEQNKQSTDDLPDGAGFSADDIPF